MFPVGSFVKRKPETFNLAGNFWVNRCSRYGQLVDASYKVTHSGSQTLCLEGFGDVGFAAEHFVAGFAEPFNLDRYM